MNITEYVAALDIGTSKMVAMAAYKNVKGTLSVLGREEEKSEDCIRRGCIFNQDMASKKVSGLIKRLNDKLKEQSDSPLEKIYVGVGGQSIHTELHTIKRNVEGGMVSQELIDSIKEEAEQYEPDFVKVLEILPPDFYLDGVLKNNPKGAFASVIEAHYLIIVGRPLKSNLISLFQKVSFPKIDIAGFFISPLATAEAVLTKENKDAGCILLEFGAGVTYLSIYKGGKLRYLVTIPLGSSVITKDISSLNISEKEAEELKIKYGSALIETDNDGKISALPIDFSRRNELKEFDQVIEARVKEIIANIKAQIKSAGYESELKELKDGVIITGGGSSLKKLGASLKQELTGIISVATISRIDSSDETINRPGNATVIGLLSLGKDNCAKDNTEEERKKKEEEERKRKEEERKKKEEEDRKKKEEEEKKKKKGFFGKLKKQVDIFAGDLFEGTNATEENKE